MAGAIVALLEFGPKLVNLAEGLISATDTAKRNAQLLEFQKALIGLNTLVASVQQENATLLREKDEAKAALKAMEDWEGQKQRYKLASPYRGFMVYALQKAMSGGEPPHYICTSCFQKGQRSILQGMETGFRRKAGATGHSLSVYACPECKAEATTPFGDVPAPKYVEEISTRE